MKLIKVVDILAKQGLSVSYRYRSDGGISITYLAGVKYSGSRGNMEARRIVGSKLSDKQIAQRAKAFSNSPIIFDKEFQKQLKKTQRDMREHPSKHHGRISARLIKAKLKDESREDVLQHMKNLSLIARGIAYRGSVEALIGKIERLDLLSGGTEFQEVINRLNANIDRIPDKLISPLNSIGYDVEKGATTHKEGAQLMLDQLDKI